MMKTTTIKCKSVIFDMDGVITHTMPDHYRAWKKVLADEDVHVNYLDIYTREGQRGLQSVKELFTKYKKPFSESHAKRLLTKKEVLFKKIVRARFIQGSRNFIKKLYRNRFHLGLVTGTSRHELEQILPVHIKKLFSVIITGNDVTHGKPHPEPYMKSLLKLNVQSHDAVVIENAPFGIESAKKAGIRCLALETSLPKSHLKAADITFSSIKEMEDLMEFQLVDG